MLIPGDPVPTLYSRSRDNPRYSLDSVAGRIVVLSFVGSLSIPGMEAYARQLIEQDRAFDDGRACCFIVSGDPADEARSDIADRLPGIRFLWDGDGALASAFGCLTDEGEGRRQLRCATFILDAGLRVIGVLSFDDPATHFARLQQAMARIPSPIQSEQTAPVLIVPHVLEPALCREFIAYAEGEGLEDSGFMRTDPVTGKTQMAVDHVHKRRSDCSIEDERLRTALRERMLRRLVPAMERAFQFRATRIERYIVACYDAGDGGWFRPHKDNTTLGTAHRRFAVSLNLNAEEYEGGDLRFPEFGQRTYRAPTGGAVVFSCSLLHEATPITKGVRYCTLPFLYDDAAAKIRLANAEHLEDPDLRESVRQSVLSRKP